MLNIGKEMALAGRFRQCMKHKKCLEKKFGSGARTMLSQNIANGAENH